MEIDQSAFFERHPDPMWVYDVQTLAFLAVNDAAVERYGWSREEFLRKTLRDIRARSQLPSLFNSVAAVQGQQASQSVFEHLLANGQTIQVEVNSRPMRYAGREARVVVARDVSRVAQAQERAAELVARERGARSAAQAQAQHMRMVFESMPGCLMLLDDQLRVITASQTMLRALGVAGEQVGGRLAWDLFAVRQGPGDALGTGAQALREALDRARAGEPAGDTASAPCVVSQPPHRHWLVWSQPVRDPQGKLVFILCSVEDVTQRVQAGEDPAGIARQYTGPGPAAQDPLVLQSQLRLAQLHDAMGQLRQRDAMLRNAQRLVDMADWELRLSDGALRWSDHVYELFGVSRQEFGHTLQSFMDLVHPDDLPDLMDQQERAIRERQPMNLVHRIVRPDGQIRHVREVAEVTETPEGPVLAGVVQDVTQQQDATERAAEAASLLRMTGRIARLGAWRFEPGVEHITWSAETCQMHEEPPGTLPRLAQALAYYLPEDRDRIMQAVSACSREGTPFDLVARLRTARGREVWVRTMGEAERELRHQGSEFVWAVRGAFQDVTELMSAREASERMSRRLADTLERISEGFYILDSQARVQYVNSQALKTFMRSREELLGASIWVLYPDVEATLRPQYELAMSSGRPVEFDFLYERDQVWFRVRAYPTPDGLAVYFRDTTSQRRIQQELALLQTATARQNDILLITEAEPIDAPDGPRIVYVNDAFVRITGYTREEVIGKTPRILQGPRTDRAVLDRIGAALRQWRPVREEVVNYTRDGRELWLEIDIVPIANETGWYTHWVAVERDVTQRRLAEQSLRVSEERFRLLSQATTDVIWDWDCVSNTLWCSEGMRDLIGQDPATLGNDPDLWGRFVHPQDREWLKQARRAVVSGRELSWSHEYRQLRPDGGIRDVIDRGFLIRDENGRALRMVGSVADVTEQKRLQATVRQAQRMDAIGQLTGGVAHDFNNLLTVILGNAELLTEQLTGQERLWHLADMTRTAAMRGSELTSRLLAFARRQALDPRPTDVNALLQGMLALLRRSLGEHIEIRMLCDNALWHALVDPAQLEAAILNLCINSRDAMPRGGRLTLETTNLTLDAEGAALWEDIEPGHYVSLTVSDNGTGMDAATQARAFEPFFTTKEVGKGSGLGLSMVWGFAHQSRGVVSIYSEPGAGTSVKLLLPRAEGAQLAASDATQVDEPRGQGERVLVVEDDDLVRAHVEQQLHTLGYRVSTARDGRDALIALREGGPFDLLFTDIVMPGGLSGSDLALHARELHPDLPVLFTSGYTENALMHHGRLDAGVLLLQKPYRRAELAAKLRQALAGRARA